MWLLGVCHVAVADGSNPCIVCMILAITSVLIVTRSGAVGCDQEHSTKHIWPLLQYPTCHHKRPVLAPQQPGCRTWAATGCSQVT